MTYKEASVYLDNLSKYGSVLGLDTIRNLLQELGNPQDSLSFIHVAGTNGKGSIVSMLSSILTQAGLTIGTYTSPAVITYLERYRINGQDISEDEFAELVEEVKCAAARMEAKGLTGPTVFEVEPAAAFLCFKKHHCDLVVLETGMGGLTDATNIVKNTLMCIFASISMDHIGVLGNTLEEIAECKAGIIKPGALVVSAPQKDEVEAVIRKTGEQMGVRVSVVKMGDIHGSNSTIKGQKISYKNGRTFDIPLSGSYQLINAAVVLEAADKLKERFHLTDDVVAEGLRKVVWMGRMSVIMERPLFILDGAHNEAAAMELSHSVRSCFPNQKLILIMGVFKDKEYTKIVREMLPLSKVVYTIDLPNRERGLPSGFLSEYMENVKPELDSADVTIENIGEISRAARLAVSQAGENDVILACGSLSYLGILKNYILSEEFTQFMEAQNDRS